MVTKIHTTIVQSENNNIVKLCASNFLMGPELSYDYVTTSLVENSGVQNQTLCLINICL